MAQVKTHVKCKALKMDLSALIFFTAVSYEKNYEKRHCIYVFTKLKRVRHALNVMNKLSNVVGNPSEH
jgi:hypothetical protein